MAIGDDFSVAANGDIRHVSGTTTYTVLEVHRWLQDLADDQQASGNDLVDITVYTPSERATDNIITLLDYSGVGGPTFNIDDTAAQFIYDGSITQRSQAERYSGLVVVGSVETGTQLQIVQNGALLTNYWGTGLNDVPAENILLRIMVKTRVDNVSIDGGRIRVQARELSDSYAEFSATLGLGNATAAIFTSNDLNNQTAPATIATWDQFSNTEGYQLLDISGDGTTEPYYSQWDIGGGTTPVSPDLGDLYEYTKYVGRRGTAETIHGLNGELFRGITHQWAYDAEAGVSPATNDDYAWGLNVAYTGQTVNFTVGEAVWFNGSSAIRGRILAIDDNGATGNIIVAMEAGTPLDTHTIAGQESGGDGTVSGAPVGEATGGGLVRLLAIDDAGTTGTVWVQLLRGTAPADNVVLWEATDVANALTVNGAVTSRTVSPEFIGSFTGSNILGAFGIGVQPADAVVGDSYTDLLAAVNNPPNNVTFTVGGLVSGEDRVLVTNEDGAGGLDYTQLTLQTSLVGAAETAVVCTTGIPSDTPPSGVVRVELDSGIYKYQPYDSISTTTITNDTFDISTLNNYTGDNATAPANVFIGYIDKLAAGATESFTVVFNALRTLFVRVRDGGTAGDLEGIRTFETTGDLTSTGGGVTAIRTSDV